MNIQTNGLKEITGPRSDHCKFWKKIMKKSNGSKLKSKSSAPHDDKDEL